MRFSFCLHIGFSSLLTVLLFTATVAEARQAPWTLRVGIGAVLPTGEAVQWDRNNVVDLSPGGLITVGVIRPLGCNVELLANGVLAARMGVKLGEAGDTTAGSIAPAGVETGFLYKTCGGSANTVYAGPVLGFLGKDRSARVLIDGTERALDFPSSWGFGGMVGFRRDLSDLLTLDVSLGWWRSRLLVGDGGRLDVNPVTVTVAVLTRF